MRTDQEHRWLVDAVRQMTTSSVLLLLVLGEAPLDLQHSHTSLSPATAYRQQHWYNV